MARPGYADYTRLVTSISPNVRECPPHVIWEQVRRSAIQVCKQAETWRFLHPSILLTEGVSRYEYQSPPDSRVGRVVSASLVARLEQDDEDDQASPALLTPTTADALIQGRVAVRSARLARCRHSGRAPLHPVARARQPDGRAPLRTTRRATSCPSTSSCSRW